jgi:hypothetical protein
MKFEPQWKRIYKERLPKRGSSEILRIVDTGLKPLDYDRDYFVANVLSSNSDINRFVKGLNDNIKRIETQYAKYKDWTSR